MKKFYIIAMMALTSLAASAQQTLTLSTYTGTDLAKFDGQTKNVKVSRYVFKGWNTICMPFDMTAEELNASFGNDCRLETLVGIENDGTQFKLNFQDCKSKGVKANMPYILYYTGETKTVSFTIENATIKNANQTVNFKDHNGVEVVFSGTKVKLDSKGLYGIYAKDNAEAAFVNVDDAANGFYATRCFIQLSNGNSTLLTSNHIGEGDITAITSVMKSGEKADVYNISGVKIATNASIKDINNLNKGVYVVKGKKIAVK